MNADPDYEGCWLSAMVEAGGNGEKVHVCLDFPWKEKGIYGYNSFCLL